MKLFDRQKKWEINLYSYYDHAGIVRHLEDMARQGWQLEKAGSVFWTYRRCKPAELRYAVVYFSKASQFDPEPPAEQREFWELCKATGWELVTNRYQMQIFRNPAPDAIPIETDPVVQVENVRAAMKKGSARANWCLLATSLLQLWLQSRSVYTIRDLLLSTFTLLAILIWLMLGIKAVMELIGYYRWCRKARTAAKEEGVLLSPRTRKWWQILQILGFLVTVALALSLPLLSTSHNPSTLITLAAVLAYTLLLTLIVFLKLIAEPVQFGKKPLPLLAAVRTAVIGIVVALLSRRSIIGLIVSREIIAALEPRTEILLIRAALAPHNLVGRLLKIRPQIFKIIVRKKTLRAAIALLIVFTGIAAGAARTVSRRIRRIPIILRIRILPGVLFFAVFSDAVRALFVVSAVVLLLFVRAAAPVRVIKRHQ